MMSEKQAKNNLKAIIEMVVWVTHVKFILSNFQFIC